MSTVNPFTLEVVRNAILSIAEEMRHILMRSARAPLLKEAGDLSCALTDAHGRLVAQGKDLPVHLGVMAFTVKELLQRIPAESLRPGDMFLTNAMDVGGNHLPDVKAIKPIFFGDRLVAFAINLCHWPDIGGTLPGSYVPFATELVQEGLQIPTVRLFSAGGVDRTILEFILSNIRAREEREGDIYAQYACNEVAGRRLLEVFERHGVDTVLACMQRMLEESEELMRAAIRAVPNGTYSGEDYMDGDLSDGTPVKIAVDITVEDDSLVFDFSRSDRQVAGPLNSPFCVTAAAAFYAAKALFGPEIPTNDGCYRPVSVVARPGTILNPDPWVPVVAGNHETVQRALDAVFRAFAPVLPDRIVAGGTGTATVTIISGRRDDGRPFIFYEAHGGGEGAQLTRDGSNAVRIHVANTMNTPVEAVENEYPILVEEYGLRPGSGGRGRHRGGLGLRRAYRLAAAEARVVTVIDRCQLPPWGAFGGEPGQTTRLTLNPGRPDERRVKGKDSFALRRSDVFLVETLGGGGYGPPEERPEELRERDVRLGYMVEEPKSPEK